MIQINEAKTKLFDSKEEYLSAKAKWASQSREVDYMDHVLYNLIRGLPADRGYTPITKESRLNAGHSSDQKLKDCVRYLQWCERSANMKGNISRRLKRLFGDDFNIDRFFEVLTETT